MPNDPTDGIVPTRKQAALLLGISEKSLELWTHEPWFPANAVGKDKRWFNRNWNVAEIRQARDAAGRKGSELSDKSKEIKQLRDKAGLKLDITKALHAELKLAAERGEVIPRPAFEMHFAKSLTFLSDWLDQEPPIIASKIAGLPKKWRPKVVAAIETAHRELRRQFRSDMEAAAREMDQTVHRSHPLLIECDDADDQQQALQQLTAAGYRARKLA